MDSKPAILGGTPINENGFAISWPEHGEEEVKAVERVVRSGDWWRYNDQSETDAFEQEFARFHDSTHCLALANGTVAIEAALIGAGVKPGDEVIVPTLTFIATASAVNMAGAIPVFADCVPDTYQIDPADVERRITGRTTGIVTVHYAGYPSDLDALTAIAKKHGLFLIEDCAHAQGSEWRGRKVGAWGDAGTFSFQMGKSLTAGEGGAIVTNNAQIHDHCDAYHTIGRSLGGDRYDHRFVGPNYRITEFQSAILREQLKRLPEQVRRREQNLESLTAALVDVPGLRTLKADSRITRRGMYYCILRFDENEWGISRDDFHKALAADCLHLTRGYMSPVHKTRVYQDFVYDRNGNACATADAGAEMVSYKDVNCPTAEHICSHEQLTLGAHVLLNQDNVTLLIDTLHRLWEDRAQLRRMFSKQLVA